jgi:hypothetical protein
MNNYTAAVSEARQITTSLAERQENMATSPDADEAVPDLYSRRRNHQKEPLRSTYESGGTLKKTNQKLKRIKTAEEREVPTSSYRWGFTTAVAYYPYKRTRLYLVFISIMQYTAGR